MAEKEDRFLGEEQACGRGGGFVWHIFTKELRTKSLRNQQQPLSAELVPGSNGTRVEKT